MPSEIVLPSADFYSPKTRCFSLLRFTFNNEAFTVVIYTDPRWWMSSLFFFSVSLCAGC
jgi:hypothetical protein